MLWKPRGFVVAEFDLRSPDPPPPPLYTEKLCQDTTSSCCQKLFPVAIATLWHFIQDDKWLHERHYFLLPCLLISDKRLLYHNSTGRQTTCQTVQNTVNILNLATPTGRYSRIFLFDIFHIFAFYFPNINFFSSIFSDFIFRIFFLFSNFEYHRASGLWQCARFLKNNMLTIIPTH